MAFVAPIGGSSSFSYGGRPTPSGGGGSGGPTQLQLLQMLYLAHQKNKSHGFFGNLLHGLGHSLEGALKFISRPSYAIAGATDELVKGHGLGGALHGAYSGISGHAHGFGQVLSDAGILKGHNFTRGALGLLGDIATDPLMLASIAAAPETGGASLSIIAAKEAAMGLTKGTLASAGRIALGKETATLEGRRIAAKMLGRAGDDFKWQKELLDTKLRLGGRFKNRADKFELGRLESAAQVEHDIALGAKKLQLQYKIPFGNKLGLGAEGKVSLKTGIPAPDLMNLSGRTGTRIGGVAPVAQGFGRAFAHGWGTEALSAHKMATAHIIESQNQEAFSFIQKGLRPFLVGKGKLSEQDMKDALQAGAHTPRQEEFLRAWNGVKRQFDKKNKQFNKYNIEFMHSLDDIVLNNPKKIKEALARAKNADNPDFVQEFSHWWQKATGKWKLGVTVVNPGYRIRNTASDFWNMYVSGVPMWAMARYSAEAAKTLRHVATGKGSQAEKDFVDEGYVHSVKAGFFHTDVVPAAKQLHGSRLKHPIATVAAKAAHMNQSAEDWGRLTHYLYLRKHLNYTAAEAGARIRETHFDYERLTRFEKNLKGSIAPFYTWTRKNIPFQIRMLAKNPGRYSTFQKAQNEMTDAAGGRPKLVPSWMTQQMAFPVPFGGKGNMFIPQFGPTDIQKIQHPTQAAGLLSPFVKAPLELLMNHSFLTGAPIHGSQVKHPRSPISGFAASVLKHIPGTNVGTTARDIHGKMVQGPGANPIVNYLAGQEPIPNLLVNQLSNIKSQQRGKNKALLSWLGGTSTFDVNEAQNLKVLTAQEKDAFAQYIRGLRDEGKIAETKKRQKSKFQQQIEDLLKTGNYGP